MGMNYLLALILVASSAGLLRAANPSFQDTTNLIRRVSFPVAQYEIDPVSCVGQSNWKLFTANVGGSFTRAPSPFIVAQAAVATNRSGSIAVIE